MLAPLCSAFVSHVAPCRGCQQHLQSPHYAWKESQGNEGWGVTEGSFSPDPVGHHVRPEDLVGVCCQAHWVGDPACLCGESWCSLPGDVSGVCRQQLCRPCGRAGCRGNSSRVAVWPPSQRDCWCWQGKQLGWRCSGRSLPRRPVRRAGWRDEQPLTPVGGLSLAEGSAPRV